MTTIQLPLIPPPQFWGRVGVGVERGSAGCLFLTALPRPNLFCHAHATSPARQGTTTAQRPDRRRASALDASAAASTGCAVSPPAPDRSVHRRLLLRRTNDGGRAGWRATRRSARTGRGAHTVARRARLSLVALFGSRSSDGDGSGSHRDSEPPIDPHPNPPPKLMGRELKLEIAGTLPRC